jgi:aconitase A
MVIVESFERIHRSNLVGMGVLPLQFKEGDTRATLGLSADDTFSIRGFLCRGKTSLSKSPAPTAAASASPRCVA